MTEIRFGPPGRNDLRSASVRSSDPVTQCCIDENVAGAKRRWRVRQQIEAQTLQLRAKHGLGQWCDGARPFRNCKRTPCAGVLDHRSNVVAEKARQPRRRGRRDRVAKLTCCEVLEQ